MPKKRGKKPRKGKKPKKERAPYKEQYGGAPLTPEQAAAAAAAAAAEEQLREYDRLITKASRAVKNLIKDRQGIYLVTTPEIHSKFLQIREYHRQMEKIWIRHGDDIKEALSSETRKGLLQMLLTASRKTVSCEQELATNCIALIRSIIPHLMHHCRAYYRTTTRGLMAPSLNAKDEQYKEDNKHNIPAVLDSYNVMVKDLKMALETVPIIQNFPELVDEETTWYMDNLPDYVRAFEKGLEIVQALRSEEYNSAEGTEKDEMEKLLAQMGFHDLNIQDVIEFMDSTTGPPSPFDTRVEDGASAERPRLPPTPKALLPRYNDGQPHPAGDAAAAAAAAWADGGGALRLPVPPTIELHFM